MGEASVWFRAAIGRRKNAEARWLLPMICRRGGIDKRDIGTIRIMDTTTEFEIAARVADAFAVKIRRPDKEDSIRIEPLADAPRDQPHPEKRSRASRREAGDPDHGAHREDRSRGERAAKPHGKPHREGGSQFSGDPAFGKKNKHRNTSGHAGPPSRSSAPPEEGKSGKKMKKKHRH